MKKLFLALVAASTLLLTACSSCLGTTPTPGEAAPQGKAPDDTQSMVLVLDSLLKAGNGAQFYAILANVPEKMMEVTDTTQAREYLIELQEYLSSHQEQIDNLVQNTSDAIAKTELPASRRSSATSTCCRVSTALSCPSIWPQPMKMNNLLNINGTCAHGVCPVFFITTKNYRL